VSALAAIGLWGTLAALGLKLAHVPPFLLVGIALVLGALVGARGLARPCVGWRVLALGVYGLFGFHFLLFLALRLAPPVEANLVNYLWPLLIVVLSPFFVAGTTLAAHHVAGALAGFAGAGLLVTDGGASFSAAHALGYALAFGSALVWATYSLATRRLAGLPTSTVSVFCLASGLLALVAHALFEPRYVPVAADWPYLLVLGMGPMGAAFYLWDRALKIGDPRAIGSLAYLTPLASTLLVVAIGAGRLTATSLVAMALIVGGAILGSRAAPARRPAKRHAS
jgi:drug/metabolite transporter (DMT)-like permease